MTTTVKTAWRLFLLHESGRLLSPYVEAAYAMGVPSELEGSQAWQLAARPWRVGTNVATCAQPTEPHDSPSSGMCSCGIHAILDHDEFTEFLRSWMNRPVNLAAGRVQIWGGVGYSEVFADLAWPTTVRASRARLVDIHVREGAIGADAAAERYRMPVHRHDQWPPPVWPVEPADACEPDLTTKQSRRLQQLEDTSDAQARAEMHRIFASDSPMGRGLAVAAGMEHRRRALDARQTWWVPPRMDREAAMQARNALILELRGLPSEDEERRTLLLAAINGLGPLAPTVPLIAEGSTDAY